ncbi:MAG TPA: galactose mutarotase [Candidatus Merdenecus merdavium]|nr:galactose mutarotase [Candidatus Merdenecus merdavium]
MTINKRIFGTTTSKETAYLFTLENELGMKAVVTNYGASLVSFIVPKKDGSVVDVVLGYDTLEEYENNSPFFGNVIGRNGNRIENGTFSIDEIEYQLEKNESGNSLHSCPNGYNTRVWKVENPDEENNSITFSLDSPHMDQGFPGNFQISITYTLLKDGALELHYTGKSDKKTVANLTNHSYFNLNGHDQGTILNHKLWLNAGNFTPVVDSKSIPTGVIESVKDTPMDFTTVKEIGKEIDADYRQLQYTKGYDHNYVVDKVEEGLIKIAEVFNDDDSVKMEVFSDLPGVQLYTGNLIGEKRGKNNAIYGNRSGLCLETQYFPNAVNEPSFLKPILDAGEVYDTKTIYKVRTE